MKMYNVICWIVGLGLVLGFGIVVQVVEVGGLKFDDIVKIGGKEFKVNGVGVCMCIIIKVYFLVFYLFEKKDIMVGVFESLGLCCFIFGMLCEVTGDELGQVFLVGIIVNIDKVECFKFVNQLVQFGEVFVNILQVKKGDFIIVDWIFDIGIVMYFNGK